MIRVNLTFSRDQTKILANWRMNACSILLLAQAGRGERIRTSGLYVPNVALYQTKLHPEKGHYFICATMVLGWINRGAAENHC